MKKSIETYLANLNEGGLLAPRKFIFFDSCAIQDLIRERNHFYAGNVNFFKDYKILIDAIKNQQVFAISSYMVDTETRSNYDARKIEYNSAYNNAINKIKAIQELAKYQENISRKVNYDSRYKTFAKAEEMFNELNGLITFLDEKIEYDQFAMQRVMHKLPPAHVKHEYKDAFIWGNCIDFKNSTDNQDRIYFFTTNPEDFVVSDKVPEIERIAAKDQLTLDCDGRIEIVTSIHTLVGKLFH